MLKDSYLSEKQSVTIIGTGNYGRSFAKRLLKFGFAVNFGSRHPDKSFRGDSFFANPMVSIQSLHDVWKLPDTLVIFAVKPICYESVLEEIFHERYGQFDYGEKVVIDVSNNDRLKLNRMNRERSTGGGQDLPSNAEILSDLFAVYSKTNSNAIVKAFNSISAYTMSCEYADRSGNGFISSIDMILIASDDNLARNLVMKFANQIGFHGFEVGFLKNARKLENLNDKIFTDWYYPSAFCIGLCLFNAFWYFFYSYVSNAKYKEFSNYINAFAMLPFLNRLFGFNSIQLLSYVYLAGLVATLYQLFYGTRNIKFPAYLDLWLKSRKHLGLWAFLYGTVHVIISLCILDAGHYSPWYKPIKPFEAAFPANLSSTMVITHSFKLPTMTLHGEMNVLTGICSYLIMCVLAVTSINSISWSLNKSEWTFIHSKGGYLCLTVSLIHVLTMFSRFVTERELHKYSVKHILTRMKLYICIVPIMILFFKLLLTYFRPLSRRVEDIRNGSICYFVEKKFKTKISYYSENMTSVV
jgi:predicted dinucleotide-binding enzyme/DMSO/TMAO reductase YedYZ heme-binding membrane subunit